LFVTFTIFYYNNGINLKQNCSIEKNVCSSGYICNFNEEKCVAAEKCPEENADFCITLYDPVCSNGKEYSNSCFACKEDVKNYYKGRC
jgi:hypothetical protein